MTDPKPRTVFDAHLHIIPAGFPLVSNNGYQPEFFSSEQYLARMEHVELIGGAIVSGSFQSFDQSYLKWALSELGDGFVGVTQLPERTSDEEIVALDRLGVRAVRFNLKRGGSAPLEALESFATRIHRLCGWHVELYVDSTELAKITDPLMSLPKVSIDHLGLSRAGLELVCEMATAGIRVKATGFGRLDFPAEEGLERIYRANEKALLFGTDLPSTRAPVPFSDGDIDLVQRTLGEVAAQNVLWRNAVEFYGRRSSSSNV